MSRSDFYGIIHMGDNMCGRFTVNYTYEQMLEYLGKEYSIFDFDYDLPRYNIAPGQQLLSVIYDGKNYRVGTFKWGLVPSFSKDDKSGFKMINARSEGIEEKASFRDSFFHKRCIILSDGFYEWDNVSGSKKPYYITFDNKKLIAYAGIWSHYVKNGKSLYTCSIITTKANDAISAIHERMPVILDNDKAKQWIGTNNGSETLKELLTQYPSERTHMIEVSTKVNKVVNDDPSLIEEHQDYTLF
jgi:putative SOS response-associated peptidase YedK